MAAITFPTAAGPVAVATQAVYTRTAWANAWTLQPDLWCQRVTRATGETLSAAEFRYRFGGHLAAGSAVWTTKPVAVINPLSYVAVVVAGSGGRAGFTWYGLWRGATKTDVDQTFSAVGIEQALDEPCLDSPWWDGAAVKQAGVGLPPNADGRPNRSAAKQAVNGQSVYVWEPDEDNAEYWSTRDLVETLLAMAAPKDALGSVLWNWTPVDLTQLPDFDQPRIELHNVSYLELLRSLVTRYQLTGFTVEPPASGTDVNVRFFTFAESAISLTDAHGDPIGSIPACANRDTLTYAGDQSSVGSFATEASNVADQIVVIGARRKTVCTLWQRDNAWWYLWPDDLRDEYVDGASQAADYPPDDEVDLRAQRNADARSAERLRPVYSHFGPTPDWDQIVTRGDANYTVTTTTTGGEPQHAYPIATDDDGNQVTVYKPLLSILDRLPLLSGYEHDRDKIAENDDSGYHAKPIEGQQHEPLPPLVYARVITARVDTYAQDRWQAIDQLARAANLEQLPERAARAWSAEVRTLRDQLGLEIRVQGAPQHVLDVNEQANLWLATETRDIPGSIDWGRSDQDLVATVCFEDPRRVEVRFPADADVSAFGELVRRLRIEAPEYELVYVIPDTIVGLDPEILTLLTSDGGYLIDDRGLMRILAQRLYQWHRVPRYALTLSTGWVDGAVKIGHLVTAATDAAGTFPVLSVISEISVTFPIASGGTPPRPSMSLATAFGELGR